jgi:CBS domain-containing protein
MRIGEVLKAKGGSVTTLEATATVRQLLELLVDQGIGSVVVVSSAGDLVGMVNERDIVHRLRHGESVFEEPVAKIMNVAVTCTSDDGVDSVLETMTDRRTRHLPVVDDGRLVGLVSIGDLVKSRIEDLRHERDQMSAYISGQPS